METAKRVEIEEEMSILERAKRIGELGRELERQLISMWDKTGTVTSHDYAFISLPTEALNEAGIAANGSMQCYVDGDRLVLQAMEDEDEYDV